MVTSINVVLDTRPREKRKLAKIIDRPIVVKKKIWHGSQFQNVSVCSRSRKVKILTIGIHLVFRGLNFKPDAEIGPNETF